MAYSLIYADPPWDYETVTFLGDQVTHSASMHYPTMSLTALAMLPIERLAADDALLLMWTTGPKLQDSCSLCSMWGFTYRTVLFVWEKQCSNVGFYTMSSTEFCIVAKRGSIPTPRGDRSIRQFHTIPRLVHSRKPKKFRRMIDRMFPDPSHARIELFARRNYPSKIEGIEWHIWGNEVTNTIEIQ